MLRFLLYCVATTLFAACGLRAQSSIRAVPATNGDASVTTITGESWLNHLGRSFNETSMGKTDQLGPRAPELGQEVPDGERRWSLVSAMRDGMLQGSDLYRLNCQGCHRESGRGAPPEINSILDPIRATSSRLTRERMKNAGMDISRAVAAQLASQSERALLQRLHAGGEDMPGFAYLGPAEIRSLVAYLKEFAGVPGVEADQRVVRESPLRVGELIVKSTCHTCHDAAGPNPNMEQMEDGAIPPLATLTARTNLAELVRKVTVGAPLVAGNPPALRRGRMPVFSYLSQDEAADVYLYLSLYPPSGTEAVALGRSSRPPTQDPPEALLTSASIVGPGAPPDTAGTFEAKQSFSSMPTLLVLAVVCFTVVLLGGGFLLTLSEFRKLSARSNHVERCSKTFASRRRTEFTTMLHNRVSRGNLQGIHAANEADHLSGAAG